VLTKLPTAITTSKIPQTATWKVENDRDVNVGSGQFKRLKDVSSISDSLNYSFFSQKKKKKKTRSLCLCTPRADANCAPS
jgi:hypothetical protein